MHLEPALDELLASRLQQGSDDEIYLIIHRTMACLATLEHLFGIDSVSVRWNDLYRLLINTHEDWYMELPVLPPARLKTTPAEADAEEFARPITFQRKPRLPPHRFAAAWTIGRRIRLLVGHGNLRLHEDARQELQRLMRG